MGDVSEMRDYRRWHDAYDDPASDLSQRLTVVRASINATLDARPHRPTLQIPPSPFEPDRDLFTFLR